MKFIIDITNMDKDVFTVILCDKPKAFFLRKPFANSFNRWTKDIRKEKQKEINKAMVISLLDPYTTQEEIAKDFGCDESTVKRFKSTLKGISDTMSDMPDDDKLTYLETLRLPMKPTKKPHQQVIS